MESDCGAPIVAQRQRSGRKPERSGAKMPKNGWDEFPG